MLRSIYVMLRDKRPYADRGPDYFDTRDAPRIEHDHVHRLEQLGFTVVLTPQSVT